VELADHGIRNGQGRTSRPDVHVVHGRKRRSPEAEEKSLLRVKGQPDDKAQVYGRITVRNRGGGVKACSGTWTPFRRERTRWD